MQNPTFSASDKSPLRAAADPIPHMDVTLPVRSDYGMPQPAPQSTGDGKRRERRRPKAEKPPVSRDRGHTIDEYV